MHQSSESQPDVSSHLGTRPRVWPASANKDAWLQTRCTLCEPPLCCFLAIVSTRARRPSGCSSPAWSFIFRLWQNRTSCVHHSRFIRSFLSRCFCSPLGLVRKINGVNDQQSTICNVCDVSEDEDKSIPCCPTLGSLTPEQKNLCVKRK